MNRIVKVINQIGKDWKGGPKSSREEPVRLYHCKLVETNLEKFGIFYAFFLPQNSNNHATDIYPKKNLIKSISLNKLSTL